MPRAGRTPSRIQVARQRASARSVWRPGPFGPCAALPKPTLQGPASRGSTGCPCAPVRSLATWGIPAAVPQAAKASHARGRVPNSRPARSPSAWGPRGAGVTRHAMTVC